MSGLFEHLSANDEYAARDRRKFAAVVHKRLDDRLGNFLREAADKDDFEARLSLVEEDLEHIIAATADEYLDDLPSERIATVKQSFLDSLFNGLAGLAKYVSPALGGLSGGMPTGALGLAGELAGGQTPGPHMAAGGFCDECRKWKSGPKAGCTCGDSSDSDDDSDSNSDSQDKEASLKTATDKIELATEPIMSQQPLPDEPGEGVTDINGELAEAPSAVGSGVTAALARARQLMAARVAADPETGDSREKREKVTQPAGPSPKIDKRTWKPNALNEHGNLKPIETEDSNSNQPTTQQSVTDTPDWESDDFVPKTNTERIELDTADDDRAGFATGGEEHGDHTKTWSGTDGQAKPVTSAKGDVDKNPIRTKLEEWASPEDVDAQIMAWENRE